MTTIHQPVLLREVLSHFDPRPGQNFVDGTFGGGGHALAILAQVSPNGRVLGIDWDPQAVKQAPKNKNLILVRGNYRDLANIIHDSSIDKISGILLDLGLSSDQLDRDLGGFGFQSQGILDLRFDIESGRETAADILDNWSEHKLAEIFKIYGDEPLASAIAKKISATRHEGRVEWTADVLVRLVSQVYSKHFRSRSRLNPATRVFQALRIAVNDELGNLRQFLPLAVEALSPGGRLAIISFHSGEDRVVKNYFRDESKRERPRLKVITKKPVVATAEETAANPRSRSAKLRVAEKT